MFIAHTKCIQMSANKPSVQWHNSQGGQEKGIVENWNGRGKVTNLRWALFFFTFEKWKTYEICLGLPKWEFSTGKKHFTPGKNQEKWLCPLWKNFSLTPVLLLAYIGSYSGSLLTFWIEEKKLSNFATPTWRQHDMHPATIKQTVSINNFARNYFWIRAILKTHITKKAAWYSCK